MQGRRRRGQIATHFSLPLLPREGDSRLAYGGIRAVVEAEGGEGISSIFMRSSFSSRVFLPSQFLTPPRSSPLGVHFPLLIFLLPFGTRQHQILLLPISRSDERRRCGGMRWRWRSVGGGRKW